MNTPKGPSENTIVIPTYENVFLTWFSYRGRVRRRTFWPCMILAYITTFLLGFFIVQTVSPTILSHSSTVQQFAILCALLGFVIHLASVAFVSPLCVKRLHDAGFRTTLYWVWACFSLLGLSLESYLYAYTRLSYAKGNFGASAEVSNIIGISGIIWIICGILALIHLVRFLWPPDLTITRELSHTEKGACETVFPSQKPQTARRPYVLIICSVIASTILLEWICFNRCNIQTTLESLVIALLVNVLGCYVAPKLVVVLGRAKNSYDKDDPGKVIAYLLLWLFLSFLWSIVLIMPFVITSATLGDSYRIRDEVFNHHSPTIVGWLLIILVPIIAQFIITQIARFYQGDPSCCQLEEEQSSEQEVMSEGITAKDIGSQLCINEKAMPQAKSRVTISVLILAVIGLFAVYSCCHLGYRYLSLKRDKRPSPRMTNGTRSNVTNTTLSNKPEKKPTRKRSKQEMSADLKQALSRSDKRALRELLKEGVDTQSPMMKEGFDIPAMTPLQWCIFKGETEMGQILMEHGGNINVQTQDIPSLWHALVYSDLDDMQIKRTALFLLNHGISPNVNIEFPMTGEMLQVAKQQIAQDVSQMFSNSTFVKEQSEQVKKKFQSIYNNKIAEIPRTFVQQPLHLFCAAGDETIVRKLLDAGAEITNLPYVGSPLHLACRRNFLPIVQLLLDRGADINAQTTNGWTPLMRSIYQKNIAVTKLLIERGASLNIKSKAGNNAAWFAVLTGNTEILDLLIKKGISLSDAVSDPNSSLLRMALLKNDLPCVKLLLSAKVSLDRKDNNGVSDGVFLYGLGEKNIMFRDLLTAKQRDFYRKELEKLKSSD